MTAPGRFAASWAGIRGNPPIGGRAIAFGLAATAGVVALDLALIALAQGTAHAFDQLVADAPIVGLLAGGLGLQAALFVELRAIGRAHRADGAVAAAGGGTSVTAMVACCVHHAADVLPLLGVSAAASLLEAFRTPVVVLAIALNGAGAVLLARRLRDARRACPVAEPSAAG